MLYLSDTYPESEWQSFQPPSPLAPGRSAEQASCLSLTAQLASEIFNSLKKFSLGVCSSHLKPSQPSRPCFHSQSPQSPQSQSISITRIWQDIRQTHDTLCSLCHPLSCLSFWKLWLGLGHSVHNMKRQKPSKANQHERKPGNHILASWKFKVPSPSASQVPHSVAKTATDWTALVTLSRSSWTNKQKSQISPKTVIQCWLEETDSLGH